MRYTTAKMDEDERREVYRILTSRCLSAIVGGKSDYYTMIYDKSTDDFDPEQVVDSVIAKVVE